MVQANWNSPLYNVLQAWRTLMLIGFRMSAARRRIRDPGRPELDISPWQLPQHSLNAFWSLDKNAIGCQSSLSYVRGCLLEELGSISGDLKLGAFGTQVRQSWGKQTSPTSFILTYKALCYIHTVGCLLAKWLNHYKAGISELPCFALWNVKSCAFNSALVGVLVCPQR